tara:strand:- start:106 stop:315 length:210 start_codon:yes stop_codon:yes gene_type:complete
MKNDAGTVVAFVAIFSAMVAGIWWLFYYLWNTIAAGVFGAPELTFWQSVGLLVLTGLVTSVLRPSSNKD